MENSNELEMMRTQMALLKEKLDNEQMVSEKLMRSVIKSEMKTFSHERVVLIVLTAAVMPFLLWMLVDHSIMSIPLAAVIELFMITAMAYTFYSHRGLDSRLMGCEKLVDISKKLARVMRLNTLWLCISIPILCVLMSWLFIECGILESPFNSVSIGGMAGCCIGLALRIAEYRKKKRRLNDLMQQIEDLTGEQSE